MNVLLNFIRLQLKMIPYYVGTVFWALALLSSEIGKSKKNAVDSGMASQDSIGPMLFSLLSLLLFGIAFMFMLNIFYELRKSFTKNHPTAWNFGLSITWMSIKGVFLMLLMMLPSLIYFIVNISQLALSPIRFVAIFLTLIIVFIPPIIIIFYGATALAIARGNAYRAIRDSWKAFKAVWLECLLGLFFLFIPGLLIIPIRFMSFKFPVLEYVAIGLNVCSAPYQFGMMCAVYLTLAKLVAERLPALVDRIGK
ncbi:MAG: hypothetical protein ACXWQO_15390 [Bdellovibrionota bacterium]